MDTDKIIRIDTDKIQKMDAQEFANKFRVAVAMDIDGQIAYYGDDLVQIGKYWTLSFPSDFSRDWEPTGDISYLVSYPENTDWKDSLRIPV